MRKYITDYLKAHGEYAYDSKCNGTFWLTLRSDNVVELNVEEKMIAFLNGDLGCVEDDIIDILDHYGTQIRFCQHCGKPIDCGFTVDEGGWYCCEDCFEDDMNEYYGEGKWRRTETGIGYYEHYNENFKDWWNTGIFYTEWY